MERLRQAIVSSPVGPLRLVVDGAGALTHLLFASEEEVARAPSEPSGASGLGRGRAAAAGLLRGEREDFDVPLRPAGTPFQLAVWEALRAIPYAETRSYAQQAAAIGRPRASGRSAPPTAATRSRSSSRATGSVGADGGLTGYGGGIAQKRWLLDHERRTRTGQLRLASSSSPASHGQETGR
jgi:methylated-DNA-[protein]-cysteine S-methyltransferase